MTTDPFEFDVAVSFADADRGTADELADLLRRRDIKVFLDEYRSGDLWGKDALDHLVNLYARKARYCVLLISGGYPLKTWTEEDRRSAQERALRDADEYILPVQLDDSQVPGVWEAAGYTDLRSDRQGSLERVVRLLEQKLAETKAHSGPPTQSHDLRSGNVPSTDGKS